VNRKTIASLAGLTVVLCIGLLVSSFGPRTRGATVWTNPETAGLQNPPVHGTNTTTFPIPPGGTTNGTVPPTSLPTIPASSSTDPHPLASVTSISQGVVSQAITSSGISPNEGAFTADSAWQYNPTTVVATGDFASGFPAVLVWNTSSATASISLVPVNGAPGPAYISGVANGLVLIQQGFGYQLYDLDSATFQPAAPDGTPLD
jgi:hypothetical protein